MVFLLALLAAQAEEKPLVVEAKPPRADVEFAAIRSFWWPQFRGSRRIDGASTRGGTLRLVDDLGQPNDPLIPMYGSGDIAVSVHQTLSEHALLLLAAEYWTHGWAGYRTLASDETVGDHVFPAGGGVQSRFHLMSLTLDAYAVYEEKPFTFGASIPMQMISSRFRMDTPSDSVKRTIRDVCWGGGVFLRARPVHFLYGGISAKGLTSFAHAGETLAGDFRGFAGAQWGPVTLEAGYRYGRVDLDREDEDLAVVLYGPYASLTFTLRF